MAVHLWFEDRFYWREGFPVSLEIMNGAHLLGLDSIPQSIYQEQGTNLWMGIAMKATRAFAIEKCLVHLNTGNKVFSLHNDRR